MLCQRCAHFLSGRPLFDQGADQCAVGRPIDADMNAEHTMNMVVGSYFHPDFEYVELVYPRNERVDEDKVLQNLIAFLNGDEVEELDLLTKIGDVEIDPQFVDAAEAILEMARTTMQDWLDQRRLVIHQPPYIDQCINHWLRYKNQGAYWDIVIWLKERKFALPEFDDTWFKGWQHIDQVKRARLEAMGLVGQDPHCPYFVQAADEDIEDPEWSMLVY